MPEGQRPRDVTPRPRLGSGQEELPCVQGQGQQPGGATPHPRPWAAVGRNNSMLEASGRGQEEQPLVQGAVGARVQEGLEELSHVEGQEGSW